MGTVSRFAIYWHIIITTITTMIIVIADIIISSDIDGKINVMVDFCIRISSSLAIDLCGSCGLLFL